MNKGFGVMVRIPNAGGGPSTVQPLVVVARDERDAELVAIKVAGAAATAETLRELNEHEVEEYGLDLQAHGSAKALPALNL